MKATTEKGFRTKIRKRCTAVGTYKPEFEATIDRLAEYYVRQDQLRAMYTESGGAPVVRLKGSPVAVKNPILEELDKIARPILDLERELGLTPAALRKMNEAAMAEKTVDPLAAALSAMRGGGDG